MESAIIKWQGTRRLGSGQEQEKHPDGSGIYVSREAVRDRALASLSLSTLEEAASHFNMSPRTFARRLEREGASFCDLRGQVKVSIAKKLLEQSSLPIKYFLGQAGFTSHSAFSQAFQAATGQTPKEYRKRRQHISTAEHQHV